MDTSKRSGWIQSIEKAVTILLMLALAPSVYVLLWLWWLICTFKDWARTEWSKMDMSPEELEELHRRTLAMTASHMLGSKTEMKEKKGSGDE